MTFWWMLEFFLLDVSVTHSVIPSCTWCYTGILALAQCPHTGYLVPELLCTLKGTALPCNHTLNKQTHPAMYPFLHSTNRFVLLSHMVIPATLEVTSMQASSWSVWNYSIGVLRRTSWHLSGDGRRD